MRPSRAVAVVLAALSAALACQAAWIPAKAGLAQWLLRHTWAGILAGNRMARPWPWADTRPVAVLRVPAHGIEQLVLEGNSGRNLAFGPVFANGSADTADRILSGHRDTHFRFLEHVRPGDRIQLETVHGIEDFIVHVADIVDSRKVELVIEPGVPRLSLVTCYPFDASRPGGPLRYVVTALSAGLRGDGPPGDSFSSLPRSASSG